MKIKISFTNDSVGATKINVYRSNSTFGSLNKPEVYAVIAGNATEYVDENAPAGAPQYYMFGIVKGQYEVFSQCIEASVVGGTGPGPQILKKGDLDCGYFGTFPATDFIGFAEYLTKVGMSTSYVGYSPNSPENWMKFHYKGKVLFIPERPVTNYVRWTDLYNAGLVYGVDGPGPMRPLNQNAVNQNKTIEVGSHRFLCRLIKQIPDNYQYVSSSDVETSNRYNNSLIYHPDYYVSNSKLGNNEYDDLLTKVSVFYNRFETGEKFDNKHYELNPNIVSDAFQFDQEAYMSLYNQSYLYKRGYISSNRHVQPAYITYVDIATYCYYRPVLELIA